MKINGQSFIILLVVLFQSVRGNQNAAFDKNYSDRLTANYNQQSGPEVNTESNTKNNSSNSSERNMQAILHLFRIDL